MSAWWLILTFALGWVACWKFSNVLVRNILRRPESSIVVDSLAGLKHENLLKVQKAVNAELEKRRAS